MQLDLQNFTDRTVSVWNRTKLPRRLSVRAAAAGPAEILLYNAIGRGDDLISATAFVAALDDAGRGPITLRINSPGGDVFEALTIYNAIRRRGNVAVAIDGLAASAASFIAMAGSRVTMASMSMMMIHTAHGLVVGNAADMEAFAATLKKTDSVLAQIYSVKTRKPVSMISAAMDAETWFTSREALAYGLVDGVTGSIPTARANNRAPITSGRSRVASAQREIAKLRQLCRPAVSR